MKVNTKTTCVVMASTFLLTACGGGANNNDDANLTLVVVKLARCSTSTYTSLKKDDKLTALMDDTEINVRHREDGTKEACVHLGDIQVN